MTAVRRLPFVAVLAAAFVFTPPASAQVDTGANVGTVSDSAGLRIPGAKVTVTEESSGVSTAVSSDADGSYISVR